MSKLAFFIGSFSLMLLFLTCTITEYPNAVHSSWFTEQCDTTQRIESLQIIDLVLPFAQADTLKDVLTEAPKVFAVLVENGQIRQVNAVSASTFKERPVALILSDTIPQPDTLNWLERTYLWTLADRPDYPYDRYEPLLRDVRGQFLAKRDSMMLAYTRQYPKYKLRIQSDLRGSGNQRRHLTMGKSVSPLSQHNFGLASDIAIVYKGRQLQNIHFYKAFLGELGSRYGLTWGGTFLGFIDPNHVQHFKKSSDMLEQLPALRLEYEPYLRYFKNRFQRMSAAGKADKVEDTKALLITLHELHIGKPCVCDTLAERNTPVLVQQLPDSLRNAGFRSSHDLLLVGDLDSQSVTLFHPSGVRKTLRLGKWK
ncbi:MAG: M15 family metallopeptidase [Spirosomataceae bacterium]